MLREVMINTSIRLGIDNQLRSIRATLSPQYRKAKRDEQKLRLLLGSVLREDSNCIDIGAFRGGVLREIVRVAPQGRHIAYEPQSNLCSYLVQCFPMVDVRQAAVSNEEGEKSFTYVKNRPALSGFRQTSSSYPIEKFTVRSEILDGRLPDEFVPALIKIDVEGAERMVIEGAIGTISKYKPVVLFEHGRAAQYYNTQPHHIFELLHDRAGLHIFDMDGKGPYSLTQFEESCALDERWDYVARP